MPHVLYRSLGKFYPQKYTIEDIGRDLSQWLIERGISRCALSAKSPGVGVRDPAEHIRIATTDQVVMNWHDDGPITWLISWSNGTPTSLLYGEIQPQFEPHDVILFNNREVKHKCPPPEENRWFARAIEPIFDISILS